MEEKPPSYEQRLKRLKDLADKSSFVKALRDHLEQLKKEKKANPWEHLVYLHWLGNEGEFGSEELRAINREIMFLKGVKAYKIPRTKK